MEGTQPDASATLSLNRNTLRRSKGLFGWTGKGRPKSNTSASTLSSSSDQTIVARSNPSSLSRPTDSIEIGNNSDSKGRRFVRRVASLFARTSNTKNQLDEDPRSLNKSGLWLNREGGDKLAERSSLDHVRDRVRAQTQLSSTSVTFDRQKQYTHRDDEELPFAAYRSLPRPQSASKQNVSERKRWSLSWSNSTDSPSKSTASQNEFETFVAAAPAATVNSRRPSARNSIDYDNIVDLATQGNPTAVQILHLQQKQDQLIQALDRDVNQPPTLERKKPSSRAPSVKFVDNQRCSVETQELISIAAKARLEAVEKEWMRRQELQAVQKASSLRRRGEMTPMHQPTHRRMSLSTIDLETLLLNTSGSPHHSVNTKNRSLKRQSSDFAISYHNNGTTGNGMRRQASKASVRSVSWNIMGRRTDSGKDNNEDTTDEEDEVSSDDSDDSEEVKDNQPLHSSPSTTSIKSSLKRRVSSQSLFAQQHQMLMQPQPVMYPQMTYAPPLIPPSPPQHPRLQKKRSVDSRLSNTMGSRGSKTPSWTSTSDSTTTPMRNSSYSSLVMLQQQQMMMQQQLYQQQILMQQQFIPPPPVVPATPYQYHQFAPILQTGPVNVMPYAQVLATPPVTGDSINDLKPLHQLAQEDKVRRKIV